MKSVSNTYRINDVNINNNSYDIYLISYTIKHSNTILIMKIRITTEVGYEEGAEGIFERYTNLLGLLGGEKKTEEEAQVYPANDIEHVPLDCSEIPQLLISLSCHIVSVAITTACKAGGLYYNECGKDAAKGTEESNSPCTLPVEPNWPYSRLW